MSTINREKKRIGNFTSSENHRLIGSGMRDMTPAELAERPAKGKGSATTRVPDETAFSETALSYIDEANAERELGRSLDNENNTMSLLWGRLVESRVNELLGMDYCVKSDETDTHPTIPYWVGTKDGIHHGDAPAIAEIKCPFTPMSFRRMAKLLVGYESEMIGNCKVVINGEEIIAKFRLKENHPDGEKYYWQMVSNAVINNTDFAEFIFYCPFKDELQEIRDMTSLIDGPEQGKYMKIWYASDDELPYIIRGGRYHNLNVVRFRVSEDDKALLTKKVLMAGEKLMAE